MRFCGTFRRRRELSCPKERHQAGRAARQLVGSSLLAVNDADDRPALEPRLTQSLDGAERGSARGDDILDQADSLALREGSLEAVGGSIFLGLSAHDQEREAR